MFARNVPTIWYSQNTWVARALLARFPVDVDLAAPYRRMLKLHVREIVLFRGTWKQIWPVFCHPYMLGKHLGSEFGNLLN